MSNEKQTKEAKYKAQLEALGIWDPAFTGAVHDLCMLERDQAKTRTAWRAALREGEDATDLGKLLIQQANAIQTLREALCLTPKALRRLQPVFGAGAVPEATPERKITVLDQVRNRREA